MPCTAVEMSSSVIPIWFWVFSPVGRKDSEIKVRRSPPGANGAFHGQANTGVQSVRLGQKSGPTQWPEDQR